MQADAPRLLVLGAHPDDCDISAGGIAALYAQAGFPVRFISVTNGESGHHEMSGPELASIRKQEATAAGKALGIEYFVLGFPDGRLQPTLEARDEIIRQIRDFCPDLMLTHRPNDYHPDHRYTSQLVCDAAYMMTVPAVVPDAPALRKDPVIMYLSDNFQRPYPFSPEIVIDIEPVLDDVVRLMDCHKSQFYEWLPYSFGWDGPPEDVAGRLNWLKTWYQNRIAPLAEKHRALLVSLYGKERSKDIQSLEAFELCEYGSPLTDENRQRLFPFLPKPT